jgi:hypothetical protein
VAPALEAVAARLPDFVSRVGFAIIKGFLYAKVCPRRRGGFCHLRLEADYYCNRKLYTLLLIQKRFYEPDTAVQLYEV